MNGGYVMADAKGLNLYGEAGQTLPGIYAELKKAVLTGKPVYLYNCAYSAYPTKSPVPASLAYDSEGTGSIKIYVTIFTVTITNNDFCYRAKS